MFLKCSGCGEIFVFKKKAENYFICSNCGNYEPLYYKRRIDLLVDKDSFQETNADLGFKNPIDFPEYIEKYNKAVNQTKINEGIITGKAKILDEEVILGVVDSRFIMGSMGVAVGEKITRLFEEAMKDEMPVILFTASGGARMLEVFLLVISPIRRWEESQLVLHY